MSRGPIRRHRRQQSPGYWRRLRHLELIGHWFAGRAYRAMELLRSARLQAAITGAIGASIVGPIVLVGVVVIGLEFCEWNLLELGQLLPHSGWLGAFSRVSMEARATTVGLTGVFAAGAAVFATLLGLYLTAVSVVVGTAYVDVPAELRAVFIRERVGNLYVRLLSHTASACLLLLGATVAGYGPGLLVTSGLGAAGVAACLALGPLCMRLFGFLDPIRLAESVAQPLGTAISGVRARALFGLLPAFQAHNRRGAERQLKTFDALATLARPEASWGPSAIASLSLRFMRLLEQYAQVKPLIPTDSHWFPTRHRGRSWVTAPPWESGMALRTGTAIGPESYKDLNWVEQRLFSRIGEALGELLAATDGALPAAAQEDAAARMLRAAPRLARSLAFARAPDLALALADDLSAPIWEYMRASSLSGCAGELRRARLRIGLADLVGMMSIEVVLGFTEFVEDWSEAELGDALSTLRWRDRRTLYRVAAPRPVLRRLEGLRRHLDFELEVEGRKVTADWWIRRAVCEARSDFLIEEAERLVAWLTQFGNRVSDELKESSNCAPSAQFLSRLLEAWSKMDTHLPAWRASVHDMSSESSAARWDACHAEVQDGTRRTRFCLGSLAPNLAKERVEPELPDQFGQAYMVLVDECARTLFEQEPDQFQKLYPLLLQSARASHKRLGAVVDFGDTRESHQQFLVCIDPIRDVLVLSGIGVVVGHLWQEPRYLRAVWTEWRRLLDGSPRARALVGFLAKATQVRTMVWDKPPGHLRREGYKQALELELRSAGVLREHFGWSSQDSTRHASPVLRALQGSMTLRTEPEDAFLATIVYSTRWAVNCQFPGCLKRFYVDYLNALAEEGAQQ